MKKFLFAILALAALTLVSCHNEPNEPTPDVPTPDEPVNIEAGVYVTEGHQLQCEAISENGAWAVGADMEVNVPAVWNIATNEVTLYEGYDGGAFHAVNNKGTAVGDNGEFAVILKDNTVTALYKGGDDAGSSAYGITDDGSVIAGFYFDAAWATKPCYWDASGARHDLPLPEASEVDFAFAGGEARWISGDGSVIAGFLMDDFSTWPAVIWKKSGNDYVCEVICKDYYEADMGQGKPYMMFGSDAMSLSHNGEWLTLVTQVEYDAMDWDVEAPAYKAARFNLKTKQLQIADNCEYLFGIANDGTAVGCTTDMMTGDRQGFVWLASDAQPQAFTTVYNDEKIAALTSVSPGDINGEGNIVLGWGMNDNGVCSFVIKK